MTDRQRDDESGREHGAADDTRRRVVDAQRFACLTSTSLTSASR